jgi:hypothetical protein
LFNILVADTFEDDLNEILFLIADYKANNPEFDHVINILEANSFEKADKVIERNNIDVLYISHDLDELAFKAYKKNHKTLIISIGVAYDERLKSWYIGHFQKPYTKSIFQTNLRSYLDILFFKKSGINSFRKVYFYDFSLISNLHIFWETHFSTRTNLNETLHLIYSLAIYEIDHGRNSSLNVIETEKDITFVFNSSLNANLLRYLNSIRRHISFKLSEDNKIILRVLFIDSEFDALLGDYETFAVDYLDYKQTHILDAFILEHDMEDSTALDELERELNSDEVTAKTISKYFGHKSRKASLHYSFMSDGDLKDFGDFLQGVEAVIHNNEKDSFSAEELTEVLDHLTKLSQLLAVYNGSRDLSIKLRTFVDTVLFNQSIIRGEDKNFMKKVETLIEKFDDWHKALSERMDNFDDDLRDGTIIQTIDDILAGL